MDDFSLVYEEFIVIYFVDIIVRITWEAEL